MQYTSPYVRTPKPLAASTVSRMTGPEARATLLELVELLHRTAEYDCGVKPVYEYLWRNDLTCSNDEEVEEVGDEQVYGNRSIAGRIRAEADEVDEDDDVEDEEFEDEASEYDEDEDDYDGDEDMLDDADDDLTDDL